MEVFGLFWRVPVLSEAFWSVVYLSCRLLGINPYLVDGGWDEFRFWEHRE